MVCHTCSAGQELRGKLGKAAAMKVAYAGFVVPGLLERWPEAKKRAVCVYGTTHGPEVLVSCWCFTF